MMCLNKSIKNKTMKQLNLLILAFIALLGSCSKKTENMIQEKLPPITLLSDRDTIIMFDDKFPVWMDIKDSLLVIINRNDSSVFNLIDIKSKKILKEFGRYGQGPEDFIDPDFIVNNATINSEKNNLLLIDVNSNKIMSLQLLDIDNIKFDLISKFPPKIFPASNININDNLIVGRKVAHSDDMLFIYNRKNDYLNEVSFFPVIKGLDGMNKSYYLAVNVGMNKTKIVTAFYKMDIINFYDIKGERLKTITFTNNSIPKVDAKNNIFDFRNGYIGYSQIYPTEEFVYLKRNKVKYLFGNEYEEPEEKKESYIIKLDWEGNTIANYYFPNVNFGSFCVSSDNKNLYVIVNETSDDLEKDYYNIYSYKI